MVALRAGALRQSEPRLEHDLGEAGGQTQACHTTVAFRLSAGRRAKVNVIHRDHLSRRCQAGAGEALAGLVFAYRFREDGSSEQLDVEKPPAADGGWLWLHLNLADIRACQ